jgi:SH3-like domain-containing protein
MQLTVSNQSARTACESNAAQGAAFSLRDALCATFLALAAVGASQAAVAQAPSAQASAAPTPSPIKLAPPPATPLATNVPAKAFVSVGERPAVMYDAPSERSNKTFIVLRNTPLEVLVKLAKWIKVRDAEGTIGWVEAAAVGERRFVQVAANSADVRAMANANSANVFDAQRGVLLEVSGMPLDGWLPIRHRDGQTGFVRQTQVWGD